MRLFKIAVAMLAAVALSACASTNKSVDTTELEQAVRIVDVAYTTAKAGIVVYCVAVPKSPPCNSPGAMAEIAKATAVLDVAIAKTKADILLARDADALTLATKVAMDALAIYAKVMTTYGINSGGS